MDDQYDVEQKKIETKTKKENCECYLSFINKVDNLESLCRFALHCLGYKDLKKKTKTINEEKDIHKTK